MTDPRPRSFVWLKANGQFSPQIWFDAPPAGYSGVQPVAAHKLEPGEYALTLNQLVAKYSSPPETV